MLNIEPIKESLFKASPPPWGYLGYSDQSVQGLGFVYTAVDNDNWRTISHRVNKQDGEFISRAPQDVAALIAEVERLREQKQMLTMAIEDHYHVWQTSNDRLKEAQNRLLWQQIGIGASKGYSNA